MVYNNCEKQPHSKALNMAQGPKSKYVEFDKFNKYPRLCVCVCVWGVCVCVCVFVVCEFVCVWCVCVCVCVCNVTLRRVREIILSIEDRITIKYSACVSLALVI